MNGGGEGWRIGKVRPVQLVQGGSALNGRNCDVHDLVHSAGTGHLHAQKPLGGTVCDQLHGEGCRTGHVVGLVIYNGHHADGVKASAFA